jgi:hypothetical protein
MLKRAAHDARLQAIEAKFLTAFQKVDSRAMMALLLVSLPNLTTLHAQLLRRIHFWRRFYKKLLSILSGNRHSRPALHCEIFTRPTISAIRTILVPMRKQAHSSVEASSRRMLAICGQCFSCRISSYSSSTLGRRTFPFTASEILSNYPASPT